MACVKLRRKSVAAEVSPHQRSRIAEAETMTAVKATTTVAARPTTFRSCSDSDASGRKSNKQLGG